MSRVLKPVVIAGVVEAPWSGWEEMNNGAWLIAALGSKTAMRNA
jgi:hypothetical protein